VALVLALLVQVGLGFTDIAALSDAVLVGIHLAALGVLTLAMRAGMHYVLLHEALDVTVGPLACAPTVATWSRPWRSAHNVASLSGR